MRRRVRELAWHEGGLTVLRRQASVRRNRDGGALVMSNVAILPRLDSFPEEAPINGQPLRSSADSPGRMHVGGFRSLRLGARAERFAKAHESAQQRLGRCAIFGLQECLERVVDIVACPAAQARRFHGKPSAQSGVHARVIFVVTREHVLDGLPVVVVESFLLFVLDV